MRSRLRHYHLLLCHLQDWNLHRRLHPREGHSFPLRLWIVILPFPQSYKALSPVSSTKRPFLELDLSGESTGKAKKRMANAVVSVQKD